MDEVDLYSEQTRLDVGTVIQGQRKEWLRARIDVHRSIIISKDPHQNHGSPDRRQRGENSPVDVIVFIILLSTYLAISVALGAVSTLFKH